MKDGQDDGRRQVRRKDTSEGSDEEDEMGEDEPSQPSQLSQTQTQKKEQKSAANMDVDNEEEDYIPPAMNGRRRSNRR